MASVDDYLGLTWDSSSPETIMCEGKPFAEKYLGFAVEDLKAGKGPRNVINAASNAKRALHLRAELLSEAFGIHIKYPKNIIPFPRRLDFLRECGVVGGSVLNKLNKMRNEMEHEYSEPTADETQDFIDIVELFIAATARIVSSFPSSAELEYDSVAEGGVKIRSINFPVSEGKVYLFSPPSQIPNLREMSTSELDAWLRMNSICYTVHDEAYYEWVRWLLKAAI